MPDIIQRLKDATAEKDHAKILYTLLPELFKAAGEGKIIELPCKVGTTIFTTRWWNDETEKCSDSEGKAFTRTIHKPKVTKEFFNPFSLDYDEFGKTVFLTREAAEAALKKENESK